MVRVERRVARVLLCLSTVAFIVAPSATMARDVVLYSGFSSPGAGFIPRTCPPGPTPTRVTSVAGPALGHRPVWAAPDGLWKGGRYLKLYFGDRHYVYSVHTRWGWGYKLVWLLAPRTMVTITLHGWNLATGSPIWFQIGPQRIATTRGVLNPKQGSPLRGGWKFFSSDFEVPSAGCYRLEARWKTGSWTIPFAIGLPRNYSPS